MEFAVVSHGLDGTGFMYQLLNEGNKVFFYSPVKYKAFEGFGAKRIYTDVETFIQKNSKKIIIFDGQEYSTLQNQYRQRGLKILGSSLFGEKIESDRIFQYEVVKKLNIPTPTTHLVSSVDEAIEFIRKNPGRWVLKQSGNMPKTLNYVAQDPKSEDLIFHLWAIKEKFKGKLKGKLVIQEFVEGVEAAVAGFFTPSGWLKTQKDKILLEVNFEHKPLLDGDRGPTTGEMGTIAYFKEGENLLFRKFLAPLEGILRYFSNWGVVDANCIINDKEAYLLEWTIRFGYPITELYQTLLEPITLTQFLLAMVNGSKIPTPDTSSWGAVWVLGFPTFPYEKAPETEESFKGHILIIPPEVKKYVNPGLVNRVKIDGQYYWQIASQFGYALTLTLKDTDLKSLIKKGPEMMEKIIPAKKGFYRADIGERVLECLKEDFIDYWLG